MAFYPPELTSPPLPLVAVLSTPSLPNVDQQLAQHLSASRPPLVAVPAAPHGSSLAAPAEALARLFGEGAFDLHGTAMARPSERRTLTTPQTKQKRTQAPQNPAPSLSNINNTNTNSNHPRSPRRAARAF